MHNAHAIFCNSIHGANCKYKQPIKELSPGEVKIAIDFNCNIG